MAALARTLAADGCEIHVATPDAIPTQHAFAGIAATFHRPPALPAVGGKGNAVSYADILLRIGYADPAMLIEALRAWQAGLRYIKPDLVVAEFAPTAMLAARVASLPMVAIGTGYTIPPLETPMPFTQAWSTPPPGRLAAVEAEALGAMNTALTAMGAAPLPNVAALFDVQELIRFGYPALSHYPQQAALPWVAPHIMEAGGAVPDWPPGHGMRVFAYLNAGHPLCATVLRAIAARRLPTVLHIPGLPSPALEAMVGAAAMECVRLHTEPVRMAAVLAECEVVVCHGVGTLSAGLAAGKRVLHLPGHLEQDMVLFRLLQGRLGTGVLRDAEPVQVEAALDAILREPVYLRRAVAFARGHAGVAGNVVVMNNSGQD